MVAFQSSVKARVLEDFMTDSLKKVGMVIRLGFCVALIFYVKYSTVRCHWSGPAFLLNFYQ